MATLTLSGGGFAGQGHRDIAVLGGDVHLAGRLLAAGGDFHVAIVGLHLQVAGDILQVNVLGTGR